MIDLRSDTVTRPTRAMYRRMQHAPLGDDGLDGDPTVGELERAAARLLGKEAGLFVPTATMGNLLAVLSGCAPGSRVLLPATSHMHVSEAGGAGLARVSFEGIPDPSGAMRLDRLEDALRSGETSADLVVMETSHAASGGTPLAPDHMERVGRSARSSGARVHIDGARLCNAAVALGATPARLADVADTVVLCLSKGLSAPAGAVLVGDAATIADARRMRRTLGGTQRQAGVVAAAGLVAIESMIDRLGEDHALAKRLAEGLGAIEPRVLDVSAPSTNIVLVDLAAGAPGTEWWVRRLAHAGVLVRARGRRLRLVTHRHHDDAAIDAAVGAFREAALAASRTGIAPA